MAEEKIRVLLAKPGLDGHDRGVKVIVGLSILSGAHMTIFPRVLELMRDKGMDDVILFGGGIIPEDDIPKLKEHGVGEIFLPGTSTEDIVKYIRQHVRPRD
jgi:methylmalonyl-CoA mutase, C-terminal domain